MGVHWSLCQQSPDTSDAEGAELAYAELCPYRYGVVRMERAEEAGGCKRDERDTS